MINKKLKFIGSGSAFNTKLGCTSAYVKKGNSLVLFDCGGDVFSRLKDKKILNANTKDIVVIITHLHPDHIGSLGDLIHYSYYILKKRLMVVTTESKLAFLLDLMGVENDFYELKVVVDCRTYKLSCGEVGCIGLVPIAVNHCTTLKSSGYIIYIDKTTLYYSGDGYEIPKVVVDRFLNGEIKELYQDTCNLIYKGNMHLSLDYLADIIPVKYRNRVFCMHLDKSMIENKHKIRSLGFNIVLNIYETEQ